MRHLELGRLDGPVLLFGGPYSNLQATRALLQEAASRGIGGRNLVCTGDVAAYCASPSETVAAIRDSGAVVVAGNCEIQIADGAPDCGCGFSEGTSCDLLSAHWYGHALAHVGDADRAWMAALPAVATFTHDDARYAVIHGGLRQVAEFFWPSSDRLALESEWIAIEAEVGPVDHVVAGHSGLPFVRALLKGNWINAGAIGMPPNDGAPATRFVILDSDGVRIEKLDYDWRGAQADMVATGLTQGYERALASGFWPFEDVLPPELRRGVFVNG